MCKWNWYTSQVYEKDGLSLSLLQNLPSFNLLRIHKENDCGITLLFFLKVESDFSCLCFFIAGASPLPHTSSCKIEPLENSPSPIFLNFSWTGVPDPSTCWPFQKDLFHTVLGSISKSKVQLSHSVVAIHCRLLTTLPSC